MEYGLINIPSILLRPPKVRLVIRTPDDRNWGKALNFGLLLYFSSNVRKRHEFLRKSSRLFAIAAA